MTKYLNDSLGAPCGIDIMFEAFRKGLEDMQRKIAAGLGVPKAILDATPVDTGSARTQWEAVRSAEATEDGGYKLPHQKYFEKHPTPDFDMTAQDLVDALKRNDCPTCKNEREVVEFNLRKPCPDCAS